MGVRWRRKYGPYSPSAWPRRAAERGLGSRIHARFADLQGELQLPDRSDEPPRAAVFDP